MERLRQSAASSNGFNGLDALASPGSAGPSCADSKPYYNPFVSHAFFAAAEASGSAIARTGWGPRHLLAKVDGRIAGIVPCYLKSHSQGEYVFDRGWADAYERAGGRYYPKLQCLRSVHAGDRPSPPDPQRRRSRADRQRRLRAGWSHCATSARPRRRMSPSRAKANGNFSPSTASCSAPTSSFTGITGILRPSTISSRASIRAIARRSSANAARPSLPASPSTGSPARTSRKMRGTRSSPSTWRPARANGAGLT